MGFTTNLRALRPTAGLAGAAAVRALGVNANANPNGNRRMVRQRV